MNQEVESMREITCKSFVSMYYVSHSAPDVTVLIQFNDMVPYFCECCITSFAEQIYRWPGIYKTKHAV